MKKSRSTKSKSKKQKRAAKSKSSSRKIQIPGMGKELRATVECVVPFEWTIAAYDSTLPAVLSTPAMIGLMELAAAQAIRSHLPAGAISVGTRIEVDHLKAVPQGAKVEAHARFAGTRAQFLIFESEATCGNNVIGRGRVFRAIVTAADFHARAAKKQ